MTTMYTMASTLLLLLLLVSELTASTAAVCLGEYVRCPDSGACVLDATKDCGTCGAGQYLCPSLAGVAAQCIADVADYVTCPGLLGTHLDASLPEKARLDYLAAHTTLEEQIMQLQNVSRVAGFFPFSLCSYARVSLYASRFCFCFYTHNLNCFSCKLTV